MPTSQHSDWWAIALSEEVSGDKPLGLRCGDDEIVLFRGDDGQVRALENRCPHRRVPLSLGKIKPGGRIQCGYHGWTYDGDSGACVVIPNLRPNESISPRYRTEVWQVCELHGFVYVTPSNTSDEAALATPTTAPLSPVYSPGSREFYGRVTLGVGVDHFIAALMDGPQLLLAASGVKLTGDVVADPYLDNGKLVTRRAAVWRGQPGFDAFHHQYPLILTLAITPGSGEVSAEIHTPEDELVAACQLAPIGAARGTTSVCWRSWTAANPRGMRPGLVAMAAKAGIAPLQVRRQVDWEKLGGLLIGPSRHWPVANSETIRLLSVS